MNEYTEANRKHWDEIAPIHAASPFYRVDEFRAGQSKLINRVEVEEVGDVRGKTLLHLQCHFGMDTMSWARNHGAIVTGADFSATALEAARTLAAETGVEARWVESDIYALPEKLEGQFDVVYTSYGVLGWLPDLPRWAQVAAHFVKPGGTFYIAEFHPVAWIFDDAPGVDDLHVKYPYFRGDTPMRFEEDGTYADRTATIEHRETYSWPFTLGDVVTSLIDAGLRIEFLHEFPFSTYQFLPFTEELAPGKVRLTKHDGCIPLLFSIKATKPA